MRTFTLSLRGRGDSIRPVEGFRPADFAADLVAFTRRPATTLVPPLGAA